MSTSEVLAGIGICLVAVFLLSYSGYIGERGSTMRAGSSGIFGGILLGVGISGIFGIEYYNMNEFVMIVLLLFFAAVSIAISVYGGRIYKNIRDN